MKKTLIALAALGAMASVHAQSSVTLYGMADVWLGQTSSTNAAGTKLTQTKIDSGGFNGSRFGLKGAEDLGGGLKAIFQFESGFDLSTGASTQGGKLFGRQAYAGLQGGFGAVTLGRQYSAYDSLRGDTNQVWDSSFAATGSVWGVGIADYTSRVDNSIMYQSPSFGGFSGAVQLGMGENKTAGASATKTNSLNLKYANGPLLVGFAHQNENARVGLVNGDSTKYNLLAASYDFGVVSLTGGYNDVKQGGARDKEFQIGLTAPLGSAAAVSVGYAAVKADDGFGNTTKAQGFGIAAKYSLSKRTFAYVGLNQNKVKNSSVKDSIFAVGLRHAF